MSRQETVEDPLVAAADWIGGRGRGFSAVKFKTVAWTDDFSTPRQDILGFACTLDKNVKVQMDFGFDFEKGFYIKAQKGEERRVFVQTSGESEASGFSVGRFFYQKTINTTTERKGTEGDRSIVEALLSGRIW